MLAMTEPQRSGVEPGILPLFRIFVALEILLLFLRMGLEAVFRSDFPLLRPVWPGIVFLLALLAYLSWPRFETAVGRFYLPLALVASIGVTIVAAAAGMKLRLDSGVRAEELVRGSWILIVVLLVPLVIVAWQYGFRWVLWFCALSAAAELVLLMPLAGRGAPPALALMAIAVVRCLFFVPVGYAVARLAAAQREQRAQLARANARLARYATTLEQLAVSRERNRLAYELHDTLAHGLSSVAVQLEAMRSLWTSQPDKARAMLGEALEATRTALGEARRAIGALRASPLEDLGLARALRELAQSYAARGGLALELDVPAELPGLDSAVEHAVYRIAAEALANVERHAQARRVTVRLQRADARLALLVADDGRGFARARCGRRGQLRTAWHARARAYDRSGARDRGRPGKGKLGAAHGCLAMIRVLVCDDQQVVCEGLRAILGTAPNIEVIGFAHDGVAALERVAALQPDVVLMDLKMPVINGVQATREIRTRFPAARVLVLTTYDADQWVLDAVRAGASGYLLKDSPRDALIAAVEGTAAGKTHLDPGVAGRLLEHVSRDAPAEPSPLLDTLTERERQVLSLLGRGWSNAAIAAELRVSDGTVRNHVSSVLGKLGVADRTQAALFALRCGLAGRAAES
jgi:DNA-binding NarL/FixJ family response regulator/signal transduction histidine kinase